MSTCAQALLLTSGGRPPLIVSYLVVAGGGGGSANQTGGGGGGGGYLAGTVSEVSSFAVAIGAGGANGGQGANTTFRNLVAIGGGAGANLYGSGGSGGSGGGAGWGGSPGGSATSGQGNTGGSGGGVPHPECPQYPTHSFCAGSNYGGAGGGAGAVGANAGQTGVIGPTPGLSTTIGSITKLHSQGGGAWVTVFGPSPNVSGAANTGDGSQATGGPGGSGLVLLAFPAAYTLTNPDNGLIFTATTAGAVTTAQVTAGAGQLVLN